MSPATLGTQLVDGVDDRLGLVADERLALLVLLGAARQRAVADLDRVGPPGDLDDRGGRAGRSAKCSANRSGSIVAEVMISLRSGPARQQPAEVAEQEVDVQAALVRLVDDDRVVLAQLPVALELGEQDAVGHQLDPARPSRSCR